MQNVCGKCFWPVCSSECGRSASHRAECAALSAFARRSEDELAPLRHLLALRCLLLRGGSDDRSWQDLLRLEDHHGVQCLIRSAEEERLERRDLRRFVSEDLGMGGEAVEALDVVADVIAASKIVVECGEWALERLVSCPD